MENLIIRLFSKSDYEEYANWFNDDHLQKTIGSIDREWLDHILQDNQGDEWAICENALLVAVIGVVRPTPQHNYFVITNIAVQPDLTGKGYGIASLHLVMDKYSTSPSKKWVCYVDKKNTTAQLFFTKVGWKTDNHIDDSGMKMFTQTT